MGRLFVALRTFPAHAGLGVKKDGVELTDFVQQGEVVEVDGPLLDRRLLSVLAPLGPHKRARALANFKPHPAWPKEALPRTEAGEILEALEVGQIFYVDPAFQGLYSFQLQFTEEQVEEFPGAEPLAPAAALAELVGVPRDALPVVDLQPGEAPPAEPIAPEPTPEPPAAPKPAKAKGSKKPKEDGEPKPSRRGKANKAQGQEALPAAEAPQQ